MIRLCCFWSDFLLFLHPGLCDAEWVWHSGQCSRQKSETLLAPDLWYSSVAFEQQISQS